MSIKSIRTGWTGISALAGNDQWFSDFESIATVTVGVGTTQAEIEFTSIPSTFQHLQIRGISRVTEAATRGDFRVRVNGDTGSNYSWHLLIGDGSSAAAFASASQTTGRIGYTTGSSASSNIYGVFVIDVLDYSSTTKNKTFRTLGGADLNGSGAVSFNSDAWLSTSAITSLKFYPSANNFDQYSHFALYGIRG